MLVGRNSHVAWEAVAHSTGQDSAVGRGHDFDDLGEAIVDTLGQLEHRGGSEFVESFRQVMQEVKDRVDSGELALEQAQTIAHDLYEVYGQRLNTRYHPTRQSTPGVQNQADEARRQLLDAYEGTTVQDRGPQVSLAEPYRARDTDADGVRDLQEIADGSNLFEHNALAAVDHPMAERQAAELLAQLSLQETSAGTATSPATRTFFGDQGNPLVGEDGHLEYGVEQIGGYGRYYPQDLRLADGNARTDVVREDADYLRVRYGDSQVLARVTGSGGLAWYEPHHAGEEVPLPPTITLPDGVYRRMTSESDQTARDVAEVYDEAYRVANGARLRLAPADHDEIATEVSTGVQAENDRRLAEGYDAVESRLDQSAELLASAREQVEDAAAWLAFFQERAAPLIEAGAVRVSVDESGRVSLELQRSDELTDPEEWVELQAEFGPGVQELEGGLQQFALSLQREIDARNEEAEALYGEIQEPAFLARLASLGSEARAIELAGVAEALSGTPSGERFGQAFRQAMRYRGDPEITHYPGQLPAIDLLVRNLPETPDGRTAVAGLALTAASQLGAADSSAFAMAFEATTGRALTEREQQAVRELVEAPTPEEFQRLAEAGGEASAVLSAFAEATENSTAGDARLRASQYLALFQLNRSTAELGSDDGLGRDAVQFTQRAFSALGILASVAGRLPEEASWMLRHGRVIGRVGGGVLRTGLDLYDLSRQNSPEGRRRTVGRTIAGLVLAASPVIGGPVGIGVAGAALLARLIIGGTSDEYERLYGILDDNLW